MELNQMAKGSNTKGKTSPIEVTVSKIANLLSSQKEVTAAQVAEMIVSVSTDEMKPNEVLGTVHSAVLKKLKNSQTRLLWRNMKRSIKAQLRDGEVNWDIFTEMTEQFVSQVFGIMATVRNLDPDSRENFLKGMLSSQAAALSGILDILSKHVDANIGTHDGGKA
jgi:hypothetical protein